MSRRRTPAGRPERCRCPSAAGGSWPASEARAIR